MIFAGMVTRTEAGLVQICKQLIIQGKHQEAMSYVNELLEMFPNKYVSHSFATATLKRLGRWSESYTHDEWFLQRALRRASIHDSFNNNRWNGKSFIGKRLLINTSLLGFGDVLQFTRYLPMVKNKGGTVILQTDKELFRLFDGYYGIDGFADPDAAVDCDIVEHMISLPRLFYVTPKTVPGRKPYVKAKTRSPVNSRLFNIGIVWSCGTNNANYEDRYCGLSKFASALVGHEGITIYSLQKGIESRELASNHSLNIIDAASTFNDFADTAALLACLDLVITVDTAVAHLAGAMGKAVWVLLPFISDGRWLLDRSDTVWYSSMRLFRQPSPGDWDSVMRVIRQKIDKLLKEQRHGIIRNT